MPKISVITINLNNEEGLRKTIESIANQTFTDYEYIIIDGGSTDGSVNVIKEYADKITYWVSEPDKGIYNAMNKGILKAKGEYVQFLNSGDEYTNHFSLEIVFHCISIKAANSNLVFFDYIYRSPTTVRLVSSSDVGNKYILFKKGFGHPSTFYRRNIFETLGLFEESFKCAGDRDFYMKALLCKKELFSYFNYAVTVFYEGGLSTDKDFSDILKQEDSRIIDKYFNNFEVRMLNMKIFHRLLEKRSLAKILIKSLNWELRKV